MQCFQKDPNLRVTARKLLRHAWIVGCRRTDAPVSKPPANFNQAVEEVKQWNKALQSSGPSLRASVGSEHAPSSRSAGGTPAKGPLSLLKQRPGAEAFRTPELDDDDNWDDDFATAISPSALQLPHLKPQDNFGGLLSSDRLKAFASVNDGRNETSTFDDEFEGELMTIKGPSHYHDMDLQEETIRPTPRKVDKSADASKSHHRVKSGSNKALFAASPSKSPSKSNLGSKFELPPRLDLVYREHSTEDYSDVFEENDNDFDQRISQAVQKGMRQGDTPQLFHPSDLTSLPRSTHAPSGGSIKKKATSRPTVLPDRPMRRTRSSIEIQKFAEDDDEDFSDIFGPSEMLTEKEESERGSEDGGLMLLSKMSGNSWLGDDEDEDDPFASMDPGWDEMDLEANIARDRHARLAAKVEDFVGLLKTNEGEEALTDIAEELVSFPPIAVASLKSLLLIGAPAWNVVGACRGEESDHQRARITPDIGDS
jgi:hypothetical protein